MVESDELNELYRRVSMYFDARDAMSNEYNIGSSRK